MKETVCKFCGEYFIPRSNRQIYCNREHWRMCPSCGKMYLEKFSENLSKPARLCSPRCGSAKQINLSEFSEISRIGDHVIIDSTVPRGKYDNLAISKWYYSQNIKCIHLLPGESFTRLEAWCDKSNLCNADDFKVYKLNLDYAAEFIEQNDVVSFCKSTSVAIGLVKDYDIFQVLTFASPRYNRNFDYEISHTCTKKRCRIVGGLDLLTSSASLLLGISSCICYVDLSKRFDYSEFLSCGLRLDHTNVPRLRPTGVFDCGTAVLVF